MALFTKEQLVARREAAILDLAQIHKDPVEKVRAAVKFTCDECKNPEDCEYSYDSYNTNGDCLYVK